MRVALAPEAAALLAALEPEDRLPYAIAFYAGLRRSELYRLEWPDVLDGDHIATRIHVMKSKSDAGTHRRPPIADNLRTILADAWERQGRPREGKVIAVSVMSGKHAERADAAWRAAGLNREAASSAGRGRRGHAAERLPTTLGIRSSRHLSQALPSDPPVTVPSATCRLPQQRAGAPSAAPGLLLCQRSGSLPLRSWSCPRQA